mgnify:CR=1 FL=1|jgi:hypothetical protein
MKYPAVCSFFEDLRREQKSKLDEQSKFWQYDFSEEQPAEKISEQKIHSESQEWEWQALQTPLRNTLRCDEQPEKSVRQSSFH